MRSFVNLCIIDDNQSITKMFSRLATMKGHKVTVVNSGRNGLSILENQIFDVTVLDISMPEFSGFDVVDALNKSGRIKEQKIVILTASSAGDDVINNFLEKAVRKCLKKPMPIYDILSVLENLAKQP